MDAKKHLLDNPTRGYRPGIGLASAGLALAVADGIPPFTWIDVPRMVRDPQVQFALKMWRSPFQQVKWKVKSANPKVAKFVDRSLRRLWQKFLPKLLDRYCKFGFGVGSVEFCERKGLVRVDRMEVVEPGDASPRVWKDGPKKGRPAGFLLRSEKGQRWASPSHAVWFAGQGEYGPFYDRAVMAGAFLPWVEKRGRNGAIHSRQQWFRKCSFSGGVIRHPDGQINTGTEESPRVVDAQDYARELMDYSEAGSVLTFTNTLNPGDPSKYEWEFTPAEARADVAGVREYPQDLDKEILAGFGIPGEVLEASEVGSGWSGRAVPLKAYYGSVDELVGPLIEAFDGPIRYAVAANFGEQWYEVEPVSLVEQMEQAGKPPGHGGQGGEPGGGGHPPQGGGGGKRDKRGNVFDEKRHRFVRPENLGGVSMSATWDEQKHPRDHGKFSKKKNGPREGRPSKRLERAADARATEHLRHAAAARKAGDLPRARAHAKAAYGHNLAALRHSEGRHAAAAAVAKRADEFAAGAGKPAELRPNADLDAAFADPPPAPAPKPAAPLRHNPDLDDAFGEPKPLPVAKRLADSPPPEKAAIPPKAQAWAKSQADAHAATVAKHLGADPAKARELLHAAIRDAVRKAMRDGKGTAVILAPDGSGRRIRVHVRRKQSVSLSRDGDAVGRLKLRVSMLPPRKPPAVAVEMSFSEDEHPRNKAGKFIKKSAIRQAARDPKLAAKLRSEVRPEDAGKLDAAIGGQVAKRQAKIATRRGEKKQRQQATRQKIHRWAERQVNAIADAAHNDVARAAIAHAAPALLKAATAGTRKETRAELVRAAKEGEKAVRAAGRAKAKAIAERVSASLPRADRGEVRRAVVDLLRESFRSLEPDPDDVATLDLDRRGAAVKEFVDRLRDKASADTLADALAGSLGAPWDSEHDTLADSINDWPGSLAVDPFGEGVTAEQVRAEYARAGVQLPPPAEGETADRYYDSEPFYQAVSAAKNEFARGIVTQVWQALGLNLDEQKARADRDAEIRSNLLDRPTAGGGGG